jgi:hypothetical protein
MNATWTARCPFCAWNGSAVSERGAKAAFHDHNDYMVPNEKDDHWVRDDSYGDYQSWFQVKKLFTRTGR